ncbi:MAG: hypothetical protein V1926_03845 [Candidatus Peregrinibacteria bacterium]
MTLHASNGDPVDLGGWIATQLCCVDGMGDLVRVEKVPYNELITLWVRLFASHARAICDDHNVPTDVFLREMSSLGFRLLAHLRTLKYLLSERAHGDVGVARTCDHLVVEHCIRDRQLLLRVAFPHLNGSPEPHVEEVAFALSPAVGIASLTPAVEANTMQAQSV